MIIHLAVTGTVIFSVLLSSCSCGEKINPDVERSNIETAIRSSIGWAADKNLPLLYSVIASDSNYLEVHPGGRVVYGIDEFRKGEKVWMDPRFRAVRYEIRDLKINISGSGSVAWWFCILDDISEWEGQPASWENTRWTGVLEKRNGKWVIVQMHFSFETTG